jgi:hypothetical protein
LIGVIDHEGGGGLEWDAMECGDALYNGLNGHIGHPPPWELRCNILTQNKFGYITDLKDFAIPSMMLRRTSDGRLPRDIRSEIHKLVVEISTEITL